MRASAKGRQLDTLQLNAGRHRQRRRRHVIQADRSTALRALKMGVRMGLFWSREGKSHRPLNAGCATGRTYPMRQ